MTTENPSRRRAIATIAAAFTAGVTTSATAGTRAGNAERLPRADEPDPVFALIEQHRAMQSDISASDLDDGALGVATDRIEAVWETLVTTRPTTRAGCAAVLRYVTALEVEFDLPEPFAEFLCHIANAIEGSDNLIGEVA